MKAQTQTFHMTLTLARWNS